MWQKASPFLSNDKHEQRDGAPEDLSPENTWATGLVSGVASGQVLETAKVGRPAICSGLVKMCVQLVVVKYLEVFRLFNWPVHAYCATGAVSCQLLHLCLLAPTQQKVQRKNSTRVVCNLICNILMTRDIYLLWAKMSRATEGATSRGSQGRSLWISCWASRVRERRDS